MLGTVSSHLALHSIVAALPTCQVFPTDALSSSLGEGAAAAHLRSKEALLALLHERVMDKVGGAEAATATVAAAAASMAAASKVASIPATNNGLPTAAVRTAPLVFP